MEQDTQVNVATDIEDRIDQDMDYETAVDDKETGETPVKKDKTQKYRISGGMLALHGKNRSDLDITTDEKVAFQETMDEFVDEVSDLADFNTLNVYENNVDWSGTIIDQDIEFTFTIGENSGIYINGEMIKVDADFLEMINKLQQFYQKFKSKWGKVLASRKKTKESPIYYIMLKILILNNYKTLLKFILWASIIYAIAYYVSENNGMSNEEKIKIDSLNNVILKIQKDQLRLDSTIVEFNKEIDKIDNSIGKIKSQKNSKSNEYNEKINRVNKFNDVELDNFFSDRYKN